MKREFSCSERDEIVLQGLDQSNLKVYKINGPSIVVILYFIIFCT